MSPAGARFPAAPAEAPGGNSTDAAPASGQDTRDGDHFSVSDCDFPRRLAFTWLTGVDRDFDTSPPESSGDAAAGAAEAVR